MDEVRIACALDKCRVAVLEFGGDKNSLPDPDALRLPGKTRSDRAVAIEKLVTNESRDDRGAT